MQYLIQNPMASGWLVTMIILLIIEAMTVNLVTIWAAVGAFVAMIASMTGTPIVLQFVLFLVVTIVLLWCIKPWAKKYLNNKVTKTNSDSLVGQTVWISETVDNIKQTGEGNVNPPRPNAEALWSRLPISSDRRCSGF